MTCKLQGNLSITSNCQISVAAAQLTPWRGRWPSQIEEEKTQIL